jgi:hypothetical protein
MYLPISTKKFSLLLTIVTIATIFDLCVVSAVYNLFLSLGNSSFSFILFFVRRILCKGFRMRLYKEEKHLTQINDKESL